MPPEQRDKADPEQRAGPFAGLERALRSAALFIGEDPTKIVVKANLQFVDQVMDPLDAANLVKV